MIDKNKDSFGDHGASKLYTEKKAFSKIRTKLIELLLNSRIEVLRPRLEGAEITSLFNFRAILFFLICLFFFISCRFHLKKEDIVHENIKFFEDGKGVNTNVKLPHDNITVTNGKLEHVSNYVNTTEIGLYLNILTLIEKGIIKSDTISQEFAKKRIYDILVLLESLETWNGLYYWPYRFEENKVTANGHEVAPAVDNGNLSFSIATVAGAYLNSTNEADQKIVHLSKKILDRQKQGYIALFDANRKLLSAGWDTHKNKMLGYHIDRKMNESRLAAIWAILISDEKVPMEAFTNMHLKSIKYKKTDGKEIEYFLTWDGTIFQAMFPALFLDERSLIKDYEKVENIVYVQEDYIRKNWIPAFISASSTPDNGYTGMGTMEMAELVVGFKNHAPFVDFGTPHATALTYLVDKKLSLKYMTMLRQEFPQINSNGFGWFDAISKEGNPNSKILSLDQGMLILAYYAEENRNFCMNYLISEGKIELLKKIYSHFQERP